jgi:hypothetical protein
MVGPKKIITILLLTDQGHAVAQMTEHLHAGKVTLIAGDQAKVVL